MRLCLPLGLYQCYVERQRLKQMGITVQIIDAAVDALKRSMCCVGISEVCHQEML